MELNILFGILTNLNQMKNQNCLKEIAGIVITEIDLSIREHHNLVIFNDTIVSILASFIYMDETDILHLKAKVLTQVNNLNKIKELPSTITNGEYTSNIDIIKTIYDYIIANPSVYEIYKLTLKTH